MCDSILEVKDNIKYLYVTSVCNVNMSHFTRTLLSLLSQQVVFYAVKTAINK